jgi:signal transduction histidine kinase
MPFSAKLVFGRHRPYKLEDLALTAATRSPLGTLVRSVARIRASVHAKLLGAFLVMTLLFIVMAVVSLQTLVKATRDSQLLDAAHARVDWSRQIEYALARQMHFTDLALLAQDEVAIGKILRENNRFNNTLANLDAVATAEQKELIEQIRLSQDEAMAVIADMANAIRDGKLGAFTGALRQRQERLDEEITKRVGRLVAAQEARMTQLRESVADANRRSLMLTTVFGVSAVALALLGGFVISWSFILPVREAQGFLDHVAAGNFGGRIAVPNRDEFGVLAGRLNHMSQELHRLDSERRSAAAELGRVNAELARTNQAKSEFLANMSHELRTPMNAILGFTEMLIDGLYGELPEPLKEPLADIQVNGRHLLRLINDVLDLSKIEAGRMELVLNEYSARELVDIVQASLRSLAAEKGLQFSTRIPDDLPIAYGDSSRITQCLMNLVGNAIKFTKEGRIDIAVELAGDELIYRVSDTGIGIPRSELENVFAEFRQVDATVTREFGGTGLGLAITKKFVEMHGGRVWVESEFGKGCTFFLCMPLRAKGQA